MIPINVLSFFDGMSCGQIALQRAGIPVNKYYAYEINKYAITVARRNWPDMYHCGDVNNWKEHAKNMPRIDLFIAGSPCQGFSLAGRQLNFDDPRSKLFFVFVDALSYYRQNNNPNIKFLLENVKMKKEWRDVITRTLEVEPVLINSALVSAQNRERYYWANFPITQPEDRGILLKDIIEDGEVDREKSYAIDANYYKGGSSKYLEDQNKNHSKRQAVKYQSSRRLQVAIKSYPHGFRKETVIEDAEKYPTVGTGRPQSNYTISVNRVGTATDIKGHDYNKRVYSQDGKSPALAAHTGGNLEPKVAMDEAHYRKLSVIECERLQTVPEGYTEGVSNTRRYEMLGNGWTVDVIAHILEGAYGKG